jgi:hypothetical protein
VAPVWPRFQPTINHGYAIEWRKYSDKLQTEGIVLDDWRGYRTVLDFFNSPATLWASPLNDGHSAATNALIDTKLIPRLKTGNNRQGPATVVFDQVGEVFHATCTFLTDIVIGMNNCLVQRALAVALGGQRKEFIQAGPDKYRWYFKSKMIAQHPLVLCMICVIGKNRDNHYYKKLITRTRKDAGVVDNEHSMASVHYQGEGFTGYYLITENHRKSWAHSSLVLCLPVIADKAMTKRKSTKKGVMFVRLQ